MNELRNYDADQTDRIIKVALALLIVTCFFAGCESESINPFTTAPDKGVTVENILSNPKDYTGKEVTVVAAVSKTVGDRAFLLHGENPTGELLVVGGDPYPSQPNESIEHGFMLAQSVRVTGTVEAFDPVAVERQAGVRRDDDRLKNYRGRAMIVARSLETLNP
ncbi:MAG TPA: hypothetical protein VFZ23_07850 [Pyrinomonadaceae bacterium]